MDDELGDGVEDALVPERELGALELVEVVLRDLVAALEADKLDDLHSLASVVVRRGQREEERTFSAVLYFLMSLCAVLSPNPGMLST